MEVGFRQGEHKEYGQAYPRDRKLAPWQNFTSAPTVCQAQSWAQVRQEIINLPHPLSLGGAWGMEGATAGTPVGLRLAR